MHDTRRSNGLSLPPEAVVPESATAERVPGGVYNLFMLVGRLPRRRLLVTLILGLLAPVPMIVAFLVAWNEIPAIREKHRFAGIVSVVVLLFAHYLLQHRAAARVCAHIEDAIADIRGSILRLLATSEVPVVQALGAPAVDGVVNGDARLIAAMIPTMILASDFLFSVTVGIAYIAVRSPYAFALFLVMGVVSFVVRHRIGNAMPILHEADAPEASARDVVADILQGPRELLVDRKKGLDAARTAAMFQRRAGKYRTAGGGVFALGITFVLLCSAFVIITAREVLTPWVPLSIAAVLVLVQGRFAFIVTNQEHLRGAAGAARRLCVLERGLRVAPRAKESLAAFGGFEKIELRGVMLTQKAKDGGAPPFTFGPADATFPRGTMTVIRGPNGSGKSTLLDILLGIKKPLAGAVQVDRHRVESADVNAYRALFSPVFATPHLYDRLYGHEAPDAELTKELLDRLELPADISIRASRTSSDALSTGQRKRLALARAVLENRPCLVLDEYTADQDASAREKFYREIVPWLKAQGRTLVAIAHDDIRTSDIDQIVQVADGKTTTLAAADEGAI